MYELRSRLQGVPGWRRRCRPGCQRVAGEAFRRDDRCHRVAARAATANCSGGADAGRRDHPRRGRMEDPRIDPRARDVLPGGRCADSVSADSVASPAGAGRTQRHGPGVERAAGTTPSPTDAAGGVAGVEGGGSVRSGVSAGSRARLRAGTAYRLGATTGSCAGAGIAAGAHIAGRRDLRAAACARAGARAADLGRLGARVGAPAGARAGAWFGGAAGFFDGHRGCRVRGASATPGPPQHATPGLLRRRR